MTEKPNKVIASADDGVLGDEQVKAQVQMKTDAQVVDALAQQLFTDEELNVYVIVDGASAPGLLQMLFEHQPEYECLFRGELEPDMAEVAPYLVKLDPESDFAYEVLEKGWGRHWGVFALGYAGMRTMRQHFRRNLMVYDEAGKPMYFRWYDPRVLRLYLPTCNAEDLAEVFGPVETFVFEDEEARTALRYRARAGALKLDKLALKGTGDS